MPDFSSVVNRLDIVGFNIGIYIYLLSFYLYLYLSSLLYSYSFPSDLLPFYFITITLLVEPFSDRERDPDNNNDNNNHNHTHVDQKEVDALSPDNNHLIVSVGKHLCDGRVKGIKRRKFNTSNHISDMRSVIEEILVFSSQDTYFQMPKKDENNPNVSITYVLESIRI